MRKWLVLVVLLMAFQIKADAFIYIDEDYTGNSAEQPNDTGFTPSQLGGIAGIGLGGPVGNQYIVKQATQFTFNQGFRALSADDNSELYSDAQCPSFVYYFLRIFYG